MKNARYLDGLDGVEKAFSHLKIGSPEKLTIALNKGASEVAARAKILAPVDDGQVRNSIETKLDLQSRGGTSVAAVVYAGGREAPGAWRAEFGRSPGGEGDQSGHPGHAAQPYLFPAYHSVRRRVRGRIKRAITALGKEIARRRYGR